MKLKKLVVLAFLVMPPVHVFADEVEQTPPAPSGPPPMMAVPYGPPPGMDPARMQRMMEMRQQRMEMMQERQKMMTQLRSGMPVHSSLGAQSDAMNEAKEKMPMANAQTETTAGQQVAENGDADHAGHHPETAVDARPGMPMAAGQDGRMGGMGMMPGRDGMPPMMEMMRQKQAMMQKRQAMMQAHMTKMETHLANIEALLQQLVDMQKK